MISLNERPVILSAELHFTGSLLVLEIQPELLMALSVRVQYVMCVSKVLSWKAVISDLRYFMMY